MQMCNIASFYEERKDIAIEWYVLLTSPTSPHPGVPKFGGNEWMLGNQTALGQREINRYLIEKDTLREDAAVEY